MEIADTDGDIVQQLTNIVGAEYVLTSDEDRQFYSMDVMWEGLPPLAIIQPANANDVAAIIRLCVENSLAVTPRGGGLSYTKGYVPQNERTVTLDLRRLNRIIEINIADMYITAQAGCTWAQLHEALLDVELRTPYWGPASGMFATVGGALSQGSVFFGSGTYGPVAESVLSLSVALGNGQILRTGSAANKAHVPFQRYFGPDLCGLFLGDAGAFGVKVEATFRLIPRPQSWRGVSFGFRSFDDSIAAQAQLARLRITSECFGLDPFAGGKSTTFGSWADGLKTLGAVASQSGIGKAVDVARAGTSVLSNFDYTLHATVDGADDEECERKTDKIRNICTKTGQEIESSLPTVLRSQPFTHPGQHLFIQDGRRWIPIHANIPLSKIGVIHDATQSYLQKQAEVLAQHNIATAVTTFIAGTDIVYEPQWFWPDGTRAIHRRVLRETDLKQVEGQAQNREAYQEVTRMMAELAAIYCDLGAVHQQLGRFYPYRDALDDANWALLEGFKKVMDPSGIMNPGALGLGN